MSNLRLDTDEIYKWYDVFKNGKDLVEIRLVGSGKYKTASGYFTSAQKIVEALSNPLFTENFNIYFTINSIKKDCYGREQRDKIILNPQKTTTDAEIDRREWVFLDFDAKRVAGSNATEEMVAKVRKKANEVYRFLKEQGFYEPITCFSGNGAHFYLKCDLAPTEENNQIIKRFTQAMGMLFTDDDVDIDQKIYNLGRISRLCGTYSCKGAKDDPERPQRKCYITRVPQVLRCNDISYFKKIADIYPDEENTPSYQNGYNTTEKFNLDEFIAKYNLPVTHKVQVADGIRYHLAHCLFDENHKGKDACLFLHNNGAIAYKCFHNSCSNKTWRDVRLMYEPHAYDSKTEPRQKRNFAPYYRSQFMRPEPEPIVETKEKGKVWLRMGEVEKPKFDLANYIPSGIAQIDNLIIGFKRKHITVWSGYRGCAKTTLLNMLILNGADRGYKSALWTGELDKDEEKYWLYLQAAGKTHNVPKTGFFYETPQQIVDKIDTWIDKYFWIFNGEYGNNYQQIIDKVRELKKQDDIDFVVLDNLMTLDIDDFDGDKNEKQKNLMYSLTKLAKELNIHIHIVCHPNKSGTFLRPNNISGSGHIPDLAQNVFILHRVGIDFQKNAEDFLWTGTIKEIAEKQATNIIEICKCRDKGTAVDKIIHLYFEPESNRLKNDKAENIHYAWEDKPKQAAIKDFSIPNTEQYHPIEPNLSFDSEPTTVSDDPFGDLPEQPADDYVPF